MDRTVKSTFIYRILRRIKRCFNWLILPDSAAVLKGQTEKVRRQNLDLIGETELVLDIGAGNRPISGFNKVISLDFEPGCKVDIRADAHHIPFRDGVFDLVWLGGVVEHIRYPRMVLNEIHRVLKSGNGCVYIEVPFFQRVHSSPHDFQRFTITGLEELCSQFTKIKSGIDCGPSSAFSHILRAYLALCFSFNIKALYHFFYYYVFGWLTLPIKYLDIILCKYREADTISFSYFYLGRKS